MNRLRIPVDPRTQAGICARCGHHTHARTVTEHGPLCWGCIDAYLHDRATIDGLLPVTPRSPKT